MNSKATRELIKNAATSYANEKWTVNHRAVSKDGFNAGVRWMQENRYKIAFFNLDGKKARNKLNT